MMYEGTFGGTSMTRRNVIFTGYQATFPGDKFSTDVDLPGIEFVYRSSIKPPEEPEKTWDFYRKGDEYAAWEVYKDHLNEYRLDKKLLNMPPDRDWSKSIPIHTQDPHLRKLVMQENFEV
jgi:hypothetical protein